MTRITRIILAALASLGVILGIYTSVKGASLNVRQETGAHQVSGVMVNLDHYRAAQSNLNLNQIYQQQGTGHGCNHQQQNSPSD